MSLRLFFGLPVPADSAAQLQRAVTALTLPSGWRWIPAANWHLTMLFIGNTSDERLPALIGLGETVVRQSTVSAGELTDLTTFPLAQGAARSNRARLLTAIATDPGPFLPLHEHLAEGAAALGFPVEQRPLLPHVTLARRGREAAPWPAPSLPRLAIPIPVERLALYRSDATAAGQRYTELWSGKLSAAAEPSR